MGEGDNDDKNLELAPVRHPEAWDTAERPIQKVLHQQKYLYLQGEKTALATAAHFQFRTRAGTHAGDWGPPAETLQSSEVLR